MELLIVKKDDASREAQRTPNAAAIQPDVPELQLEPAPAPEAPAAGGGPGPFFLSDAP